MDGQPTQAQMLLQIVRISFDETRKKKGRTVAGSALSEKSRS